MRPGLETRVAIAAPPELVWKVLTDTEAFPEWTGDLRFARALRAGESVRMRVRLFGRALAVPVRLETVEAPSELRWLGGPRGLFTGSHWFRLAPAEDGGTLLRQGEAFRGLAVPLLLPLLRRELLALYGRLNAGLKERAETLATAGPPIPRRPGGARAW